MPTIRDVAKHASVSPATVSLVLQEADVVHPTTRQRVQDAIAELGYERRPAGRPPRRRRGFHVAIAYHGASIYLQQDKRPATRRWFDAIRHELSRRGHHASFFGEENTAELGPLFREVVRQREVDGAIFLGSTADPEQMQWVADHKIPVLAINRRPQRDQFSCINIDNYNGGRRAAEHLLEHGHRRIAIVRQDLDFPHNLERFAGFTDAVKEHGLEPVLTCQRHYDINDQRTFYETCQQLLDAGATAVFCDGDTLALNCINVWHGMGVRVPDHISIIGFDNNGDLAATGQRLTSIDVSSRMIGEYAAELMQHLLRNREHVQNLAATIRTRVVEYGTVRHLDADTAQTPTDCSIQEQEPGASENEATRHAQPSDAPAKHIR